MQQMIAILGMALLIAAGGFFAGLLTGQHMAVLEPAAYRTCVGDYVRENDHRINNRSGLRTLEKIAATACAGFLQAAE